MSQDSISVLELLVPPSLGPLKATARAELLEHALSSELSEPVRIEVAPSYGEMVDRIRAKSAHLAWCPAAVCAHVEEHAKAIFKVVRNGASTYRSALVGRRGVLLTVEKLRGTRAAWVDKLSLGGYLLALDLLRRRGFDPDRVFRSQTFYGSHPGALQAVLRGDADVAAITMNGDTEQDLRRGLHMHIGLDQRDFDLIAISEAAPTDAMVLTDRLSQAHLDRIVARLFPGAKRYRAPSFLLSALDAEAFEPATPGEYTALMRIVRDVPLRARASEPPPPTRR
jgi:phosphonate transport system substrate-binding protein